MTPPKYINNLSDGNGTFTDHRFLGLGKGPLKKWKCQEKIRGTLSDRKLGEVIYHLSGADEKLREYRRWNGETYTVVRCPHCGCKIFVKEGHY